MTTTQQQSGTWRARLNAMAERTIAAGTQGYPRETRRRLRVMNMVAYLIALFTAVYVMQQLAKPDPMTFAPVIAINLALIVLALCVPFAHRLHETAGALLLAFAEFAALFAFTALLGTKGGGHLQYFVGAAAPFVILGLGRIRLVLLIVALALILHLTVWALYEGGTPLIISEPADLTAHYVIASTTTVVLIAAAVYYAYSLAAKAQADVDALLRNILPESVVERLTDQPDQAISDSFAEASVLFADMVGFTPMSKALGAAKTVDVLNKVFSDLDAIAEEEGVEKIKTIGDAYKAAAGVPDPDPRHCERLARLALRLREAVRARAAQEGVEIDVRIGMASGPVMAGVIGTKKFAYDVWGDTVNLASRMESHGEPGRIHVTPQVRDALAEHFAFERRGVRQIKGLGQVETFFLTGGREALAWAAE